MEDRFTYGLNPEKLGAVSSYLCDPNTAPAEFLLVKSQYLAETGRAVSRGALFFQIRQAFLPGEVTAEEANRIGYETAMRWTKGKHQFFVCTHTDKAHIHNHIYFNATAFDRSRKFHNFIGSSFALRRLSDRVCIEHELSVIQNPRQHSKGPAYERWAKVYNLKQMAAALQYLQEHHLTDYAALTARTEAAVDHFHKLSDELRTTEEALSKTSELMAATVDYAKTRPVFDGYKAARYSKKYLAQHEVELATYRAAKDTMNTILNGAKLPKIEALKKSRRELAGQKKELYAEYRDAQRQMREAVAIKANIDHLLGITDERENKAQER